MCFVSVYGLGQSWSCGRKQWVSKEIWVDFVGLVCWGFVCWKLRFESCSCAGWEPDSRFLCLLPTQRCCRCCSQHPERWNNETRGIVESLGLEKTFRTIESSFDPTQPWPRTHWINGIFWRLKIYHGNLTWGKHMNIFSVYFGDTDKCKTRGEKKVWSWRLYALLINKKLNQIINTRSSHNEIHFPSTDLSKY